MFTNEVLYFKNKIYYDIHYIFSKDLNEIISISSGVEFNFDFLI